MPHQLRQVLQRQTSFENLVLIFFLLYLSFRLSLDVILFPVFMVRVSVKHMMFELKLKGKMISLMFLSSLGKSLPMEHLITLTFLIVVCCSQTDRDMTHLVLLDLTNSRRPQILTFVYQHQARKHLQNIYRASYQIFLNQIFLTLNNGVGKNILSDFSNTYGQLMDN